MLNNTKIQCAIFLIALYGWENMVTDNTNSGITLSNDTEDCYVNLSHDEFEWLQENYATDAAGEEHLEEEAQEGAAENTNTL